MGQNVSNVDRTCQGTEVRVYELSERTWNPVGPDLVNHFKNHFLSNNNSNLTNDVVTFLDLGNCRRVYVCSLPNGGLRIFLILRHTDHTRLPLLNRPSFSTIHLHTLIPEVTYNIATLTMTRESPSVKVKMEGWIHTSTKNIVHLFTLHVLPLNDLTLPKLVLYDNRVIFIPIKKKQLSREECLYYGLQYNGDRGITAVVYLSSMKPLEGYSFSNIDAKNDHISATEDFRKTGYENFLLEYKLITMSTATNIPQRERNGINDLIKDFFHKKNIWYETMNEIQKKLKH